jgi:hypothetical protein
MAELLRLFLDPFPIFANFASRIHEVSIVSSYSLAESENARTISPPGLGGPILATLVPEWPLYRCRYHRRGELAAYDVATQKWVELAKLPIGYPSWSRNSKYI